MDNNTLYIGFNHNLGSHDLSLSCVSREGIFSISLERLFRVKKAPNIKFINNKELYHKKALNLLIKAVDMKEVDEIVIVNYPGFKDLKKLKGKKVVFIDKVNHHYLHSSSGYYGSKFNEAMILSVDGSGVDQETGNEEMQTIRYGKNNKIEKLSSTQLDNKKGLYGIGACYYLHSDFIGLSEGSFMGLSSYGNADRYKDVEIFKYENGNVYLSDIFLKGTKKERELGLFNSGEYTQLYVIKNMMNIYGLSSKDLIDRKKGIENSIFADIAAKVQQETEKAMVYLANIAYEYKKIDNLCLSGGVALNCLANTMILEKTKFKNIFVQPACNDQGLSLGAAMYGYYDYGNNKKRVNISNYGIGPKYDNNQIKIVIDKYKEYINYEFIKNFEKLSDYVAKEINNDKVIAWFQGGSEFGPRALGFRSIIASPKSMKMKDRVNDIKLRERWRPLAPIILEENIKDYFETDYSSPYMTFTGVVKESKRKEIPSVVHIDGTARYQTINKNCNERLYLVMKKFYNLSKTPVIMNTSFNSAGEPIIENPEQAVEMFLSTDIDYLVIGDYVLSKHSICNQFKFDLDKYKYDELIKYGRNPKDYFNEVYLKLWKIFYKVLFNGNKEIDISYSSMYNDYILEFKYKDDLIIITLGYHNYHNYYFNSILGLAVKGNSLNYSDDLVKLLDTIKNNIIKYENKLIYFFDRYNSDFYNKFN
ncbi:hypothetical protein EOM39_00285 [Candidatus Gracilibacteria bacterium]|nr:hypothetical protein [Candidatus Gracilibacteria bacterium]